VDTTPLGAFGASIAHKYIWIDAAGLDDQTVIKAILHWKRHLAAVAKQNGGPIQHIFC